MTPKPNFGMSAAIHTLIHTILLPKTNTMPSPVPPTPSSPAQKSVVDAVPPQDGNLFADVDRQIKGMAVKQNAGAYAKKNQAGNAVWNERGTPEGAFPMVKVPQASLGLTGKAIEKRRGVDLFEFSVSPTETKTVAKVAIGLDPRKHGDVKKIMLAAIDKFKRTHDPIHKSIWYEKTFPHLDDGTKVFNATQALQGDGSDYLNLSFEGEDVWDSPSTTFAPFLYDDDSESLYYIKATIDPDARLYMYNNKKGGSEFTKVTESDQVVYPKGGIAVRNSNAIRTLIHSNLYKNNVWRMNSVMQLRGITFKCAQSSTTKEGYPSYTVYPTFNFVVSGCFVLVQSDNVVESSGSSLTDKQRDAAIRACVFEGLTAPRASRKVRAGPLFNLPAKKKAKTSKEDGTQGDDEDSDTEELDSDGETSCKDQ